MKHLSTISLRLLIIPALALAAFSSCSDDNLEPQPGYEPGRVLLPGEYSFIISRDGQTPQSSRISYESTERSRFSTGDNIGIFSTNVEQQVQNDVFSARNIDGESEIQVLAPPTHAVSGQLGTIVKTGEPHYIFYFPLHPDWTKSFVTAATGIKYNVPDDQSEKEKYEEADLLVNYLTPNPDDRYHEIKMRHVMANIIVRIHKDSIDTSADPTTGASKGVTLKGVYTSASGIYFDPSKDPDQNKVSSEMYHNPGCMKYTVNKNQPQDVKMYMARQDGDYLEYRAAIPACQTINAGAQLIEADLFSRSGKPETVTFSIKSNLELKNGYYYTFTLRSAIKPAVPEVTTDDSWVLDVFDPETNEIVGLLCREYLRYQPHHNDDESNFKVDAPTGYYEGAYTEDPGFPINGYAISSHAFVFYNLFNPNNNYIPNLENGTILRMLYDVVATRDGIMQGDPAWPYPHQAGSITIGSGGDSGKMAMGIFLPKHGHRWVFDEALNCGRSSDDYKELYLHGAKIHWAKRPGIHTYTHCQTETETFDYYYIDNLEPSEDKITNNDAYLYGHIAIPDEGEPFVSYSPFNDGDMRDSDGNKIGITIEHFLKDNRDGYEIDYPLVKIGFNNFWMSKSLHTTKLSASKPLECQNDPDNSSLNYVKFKSLWNEDYFSPTILPPSYVHPRYISASIEDVDFTNINTEHPLLYNYTAVSDPEFVIPSDDDRFISYMPNLNNFYKIMNYFGWCMAAKLMTSDSWTNTSNISAPEKHSTETEYEAAVKYKTLNDAFLPGNVSGFNLQCSGNFQSQFNEFGGSANLWINDRGDGLKESHAPHIIAFGMANAWQRDNFGDIFHFPNDLTYRIDPNIGEIISLNRQKALLSRVFYPARFVMNMKGQIDSPASTIKSGLKSAIKGSRSSDITAKPKPSVNIHISVIEDKR